MTKRGKKAREGGFTLLEAIVAMVLVGTAGVALFDWVNTSLATMRRIEDANGRADATANVLEFMEHVNPMLRSEGRATLGPYAIEWRSQPLASPVDGVNYPSGPSIYQLAMYRTTVVVKGEGGRPWFEVRLRQVGYRQVRAPAEGP